MIWRSILLTRLIVIIHKKIILLKQVSSEITLPKLQFKYLSILLPRVIAKVDVA